MRPHLSKLGLYWPVAPLALGAVGAAVLASRRRVTSPGVQRAIATGIGVAMGVGLARWQLERLFTETPDFELERRIGPLEIRRYAPRVLAETTVTSTDPGEALNEGFRILAAYIFGDNEGGQRIEMTSPVTSRPRGEKIAMTAPVTSRSGERGTTIAFTMPKDRDLASLPAPKDARITLREEPSRRVAALRYRGTYSGKNIHARERELLDRVRDAGLITVGTPTFAGYDPPSTLPALRRLEAWVDIA